MASQSFKGDIQMIHGWMLDPRSRAGRIVCGGYGKSVVELRRGAVLWVWCLVRVEGVRVEGFLLDANSSQLGRAAASGKIPPASCARREVASARATR